MAEVKRETKLLDITQNPGSLVEKIASISYRTQGFFRLIHPKMIKFVSGRQVPYSEFKFKTPPEIGKSIPGYEKDDVLVKEIIPASYKNVVKFLIAIGHHKLLQNCVATFSLVITRKAALHLLRYEYLTTNMQSQKYQNQGDFDYILPDDTAVSPEVQKSIKNIMTIAQINYESLRQEGIDPEWSRCAYPNNVAQTMTFHTNFRQFRHIFDCLCGDDYVLENQQIAMDMLKILKTEAPEFFFDFKISNNGKSARRVNYSKARNKQVNWSMSKSELDNYIKNLETGNKDKS